jgi:hypothetical protein
LKLTTQITPLLLIFIILCSSNYSSAQIPSEAAESDTSVVYEDEANILYEGRIIRNIFINVLDITDSVLDEENNKGESWIGKIGNALHFKTRSWVISNYMLFKVGDTVNTKILNDSERLLRESNFVLDARIKVVPVEETDSADIMIYTQDKWTINLHMSYNTEHKNGYFGVTDDNFLGFGHTIDAIASYNEDPSIGWGYVFHYTANNIAGTYLNGKVIYEFDRSSDLKGFSFIRPFITTESKWAGGLELLWDDGEWVYAQNGHINRIKFSLNNQDIWVGRFFPVLFGDDIFKDKSNIFTAARISRSKFDGRPDVAPNKNRLFENKTLYLLSAGLINQRFYRDHYIDKFGTTEDVMIGGIFSLIGGSEVREFTDRTYGGMQGVISRRFENLGYLSAKLGWGGYRLNEKWEQNVFMTNLIFHSPLFRSEKWKYRIFMESSFMLGYNRFEGEQIYLDTETGIRGLPRYALSGTKRVTMNLEGRIFSPYKVFGFVIGGLLFTDFGLITNRYVKIAETPLYQSYGAGIRMRNEKIAGAQFQIALVYNPRLPETYDNHIKVIFKGTFVLGSRSFAFIKPDVISLYDR